MESKDISVDILNGHLNIRVAGYMEFNNKILLHMAPNTDFWNFPGGRIQIQEDSFSALKREFMEELAFEVRQANLIEICENFFDFDNKHYHELVFLYKVQVDADDEIVLKQNFGSLDKEGVVYKWFDKEDVANAKCLPQLIYDLVKRDVKFRHSTDIGGKYTPMGEDNE